MSEYALTLAKVPPAATAAVAATDCAEAALATLPAPLAVAAMIVFKPVKVALPSAKFKADLTVAVMTTFITAVTAVASVELKADNWVALKEAILLNAARELLADVPVAPSPVDKVLAVWTASMMF